jgi:hypothetical protein
MEKRIRKVVYSTAFFTDVQSIYLYGVEIFEATDGLSRLFYFYPECRFIPTKVKCTGTLL